jgi:polyketide biosynthesis enoyl-CoA hydratase PksH
MEDKYETILVKECEQGLTVTIDRPRQRNTLNNTLLEEIDAVLDLAEKDSCCRMVLLEGQPGVFCTGQDFEEAAEITSQQNPVDNDNPPNPYMALLKRFTLTPKVIVSLIDGQVMAGGVGLAAASDLVVATPRSRFSLSEALWGLLPAVVAPFLVRRVGFQAAYRMALTTMPLSAQEAHQVNLVDEISQAPHESVHRLWLRLSKLQESTVGNLKQFFRKIWLINEQIEKIAVSETFRRFTDPGVIQNINNYVKYKKFPWDK